MQCKTHPVCQRNDGSSTRANHQKATCLAKPTGPDLVNQAHVIVLLDAPPISLAQTTPRFNPKSMEEPRHQQAHHQQDGFVQATETLRDHTHLGRHAPPRASHPRKIRGLSQHTTCLAPARTDCAETARGGGCGINV